MMPFFSLAALTLVNPLQTQTGVESMNHASIEELVVSIWREPQVEIRLNLRRRLQALARTDRQALEVFVRLLDHPDQEVRLEASSLINHGGSKAAFALSKLSEVFNNADEFIDVRGNTARSLANIGGAANEMLATALKSKDPQMRELVASALQGNEFHQNPEGIRILASALDDRDEDVRGSIRASLAAHGTLAVPLLEACLKSDSAMTRVGAAQVIVRLDPSSKKSFDILKDGLTSADPHIRCEAANGFIHAGPEAAFAVEALAKVLEDPNRTTRCYAARGLAQIGAVSKIALPALRRALKDNYEGVRWSAADAIGTIGPDAKEAIHELMHAAKEDTDYIVRVAAIRALGQIGPAARGALPLLRDVSQIPEPDIEFGPSIAFEAKRAIERISAK